MKCHYKNRDEIIAKYLDRELSDEEVNAFQEHLFQCDICYQEVKLKQDAIELIQTEGNVIFAKAVQRRKKRQKNPLWQLRNKLSPVVQRTPSWAVALVVLLIAFSSYWMLFRQGQDDVLATAVYDEKVPDAYNPAPGLRGGAEDPGSSNLQAVFFDRFQTAMLEYKDREYRSAVHEFEKLQPDAAWLEATTDQPEAFELLKDYYFYWGVSHFALARSRVVDLGEQHRKQQLAMAIQRLSKADELSQTYQLGDNDRINYFLGLAYGFDGQTERAIKYLEMIPSDNSSFQNLSKFISKWSE